MEKHVHSTKDVVFIVLFLQIILKCNGSAVITGHGCVETDNSYLNPGDFVILYCFVDNSGGSNFLSWISPIGAVLRLDSQSESSMGYNVTVIGGNDTERTINSSITFIATVQRVGVSVACRDFLTPASEATCTLLIHTTSSATTNLTLSGITYQSVSLTWNAPSDTGGCNIVNYIITVTALDGSDPWNITTTDNSTSYIVTGLMFGQSYNFTVKANNCLGVGEKSNMVTVLIPGEVPNSVQDVHLCIALSENIYLLNVYWNCSDKIDPITPPVTNYTFNLAGSNIYTLFPDNCPMRLSSQIPILNNTYYYINISANNVVGSSLSFNVVIRSFILIASDTEQRGLTFVLLRIKITWSSPCIDTVQVIVSYSKSGTRVTQSSISYSLVNDTNGKLIVIENLDPSSEYHYNVSVFNGNEHIITKLKNIFYTNDKAIPTSVIQLRSPIASQTVYTPICTSQSGSSNYGITVGIIVPISTIVTAVITAILSSLITYYCCTKSKGHYSPSPTGPPALCETPVSTSGMSSLEMKDNMAYGHVTIGTIGNIPNTSAVYNTVTT